LDGDGAVAVEPADVEEGAKVDGVLEDRDVGEVVVSDAVEDQVSALVAEPVVEAGPVGVFANAAIVDRRQVAGWTSENRWISSVSSVHQKHSPKYHSRRCRSASVPSGASSA
jgi:hypothetical protein